MFLSDNFQDPQRIPETTGRPEHINPTCTCLWQSLTTTAGTRDGQINNKKEQLKHCIVIIALWIEPLK